MKLLENETNYYLGTIFKLDSARRKYLSALGQAISAPILTCWTPEDVKFHLALMHKISKCNLISSDATKTGQNSNFKCNNLRRQLSDCRLNKNSNSVDFYIGSRFCILGAFNYKLKPIYVNVPIQVNVY